LVFAALKPLVPDLTPENPYPKVAGISGRVDVTSRSLGLVVEIKAALKEGREKDIPRECMERVKLYSAVPEIRYLVLFLYDPHCRLDLDAIQTDLEGPQHRQDRSDDFDVVVVGPRLRPPGLAAAGPPESPPNTLSVNEVKPAYSTLGVVVSCALTLGPECRADRAVLRLGQTRVLPRVPLDNPSQTIPATLSDWPLTGPCLKDFVLYFGCGTNGQGEPVKYGSTGLLEVLDGDRVVARDVVDLPEPHPRQVSDSDAMNILSAWFIELTDVESRGAIFFTDVDTRLRLPTGTAKRLLARAISDHFEVKQVGDETAVFQVKPMSVADVDHRGGWSPSRDGFGGY
jgi:hypothetical protein